MSIKLSRARLQKIVFMLFLFLILQVCGYFYLVNAGPIFAKMPWYLLITIQTVISALTIFLLNINEPVSYIALKNFLKEVRKLKK